MRMNKGCAVSLRSSGTGMLTGSFGAGRLLRCWCPLAVLAGCSPGLAEVPMLSSCRGAEHPAKLR